MGKNKLLSVDGLVACEYIRLTPQPTRTGISPLSGTRISCHSPHIPPTCAEQSLNKSSCRLGLPFYTT